MTSTEPEQRFGPTSGVFVGVVGLVLAALVAVLVLVGDQGAGAFRVAFAAAGAGVLTWAYMLRPRIILEEGGATLVLRNPLTIWRIPLETVREVGVKTVTSVWTDDARYDAVAVGYPLRALVKESRQGLVAEGDEQSRRQPLPDGQTAMTGAILRAADRARALNLTGPPAQRSYAVVEIALLVAAVVAFAASYLF